jgi:hypothetical protein
MTEEKRKPEADEVSEEQLEDVAGGVIPSADPSTKAGRTNPAVSGSTDGQLGYLAYEVENPIVEGYNYEGDNGGDRPPP